MSRRKKIKANKRMVCYICGCVIIKDCKDKNSKATIEHVVPRSKLKKGELEITRYACLPDNQDKKDLDLYDFIHNHPDIDEEDFLERTINAAQLIHIWCKQRRERNG